MTPGTTPSRQRRSVKTGRVYVVKHEHGYVKIGEAQNPTNRLSSLQIGSPYRLSLFTVIEIGGDSPAVESTLHEIYRRHRIRGEWFDLPDDALLTLAKIDVIFESVIDSVPNWTPEKHLEMGEQKREQFRTTNLEEKIDEVIEKIQAGEFPRSNITPDNPAIQKWAGKVNTMPEVFVEKLEGSL